MLYRMRFLTVALFLVSGAPWVTGISLSAHHGTGISYDSDQRRTVEAVVRSFNYINPHPTMTFDLVDEVGNVEHWVSELRTNPSAMLRQGWGRQRTLEVLKPGAAVTLIIDPSRAGGNSALVIRIVTRDGEEVGIDPPGFGGGGRGGR